MANSIGDTAEFRRIRALSKGLLAQERVHRAPAGSEWPLPYVEIFEIWRKNRELRDEWESETTRLRR